MCSIIRTTIIDISFSNGNRKSKLYFRNSQNEVKHVNVNYSECQEYKHGDTITVYANDESDWYEIAPSTLRHSSQKD
ncbi:hypothetical protein OCK74_10630 [Chitinophagaceae bacterium LB-8]|uniref:Uncharacterized protein n=1 Tax=Paraflavisolibacter caeni TaxID=2982496 RepID=A0A9X2XW54_9BACT|nr:hypothetical protein [Paraflavisolibacter caeni]